MFMDSLEGYGEVSEVMRGLLKVIRVRRLKIAAKKSLVDSRTEDGRTQGDR